MIGIRVDSNNEIATGHVMRCIAIASGMKNAGIDCLFITADENAMKIINKYGFKIICINSQWNNYNNEIKLMVNYLKEYGIDKLIIDSYYVTEQYLEQIKNYTKIIYIDDLNLFNYQVSLLINYNLYYNIFNYQEIYYKTDTKLLLGCDYVPLREEFKFVKPNFRKDVKKILITTGGTDHYNVAGKLLNTIIDNGLFKEIEFHVVVGNLNKHYNCLSVLPHKRNTVVLHQNVKKMSELMIDCDIAITAGGSTMYEICYCGIPSISFSFADNQLFGVNEFNRQELITYAGDVREDEKKCIFNLISSIDYYIKHPNVRKERSIKMHEKVDGNGVKRIIEAITTL